MSIEYLIVVSAFNQRYQIVENISNLYILNILYVYLADSLIHWC